MIVRGCHEEFNRAFSFILKKYLDPKVVEVLTVVEAIKVARFLSLSNIILEGDSIQTIQKLNKVKKDFQMLIISLKKKVN